MADIAKYMLPQNVGYGVVGGVTFFFAFGIFCLSYFQSRYTKYSTKGSEEYNTA